MALTYDQRQKALSILNKKKASAPVSRESGLAEIQAFKQQKLAELQAIEDAKETIPEKIANFTGGKELAQGGGQALASGTVNRLSEESLNRGLETQTKLINAIKEAREIGDADIEARLKAQLKNIDFGQGIQEGFTNDMVSNREVIGSAIQLGTTATGAFAGSKAIGAASKLSPFMQILAGGAAEGAVQGLGFGAGEEIKQEDATLGSVAKEGLKGAAIGGGIGIAGGAVIGGTLPAIGKVSQKLFPKGTLEEAIQKITQKGSTELGKGSSKKLNQQVTNAITLVDPSDVKSYSDFTKLFDDKASELLKAQDTHLSQFTQKLDNNAYTLRKTTKGGNSVSKNYVDEAFDGLEDLYVKTNDIESLTDLRALRQRANAEGLTIKEINDISRTYGKEIASKAYKTDAQGITTQVSSTTPESFEATRKGLKETIRESTPDQLSKQIDSEITDVIAAKTRFAKLSDDVAQMNLKAQEVNGLGKIAKPILDLMDTLSFGFTKGALQALRKESGIAGKSYMNIVEAEKLLSKRLKNVEKLMNQAKNVTDEKGVKSILESKLFKTVFDTDGEFDKLKQTIKDTPNKQGGFVKVGLDKADGLTAKQEKTLAVLHNLSESNLKAADDIGGLANPSIAVLDPKKANFETFGDITLISSEDMLKTKKLGVYGADIYSPRFPETVTQFNQNKLYDLDRKLGLDYDNSLNRIIESANDFESAIDSGKFKKWFLENKKGIDTSKMTGFGEIENKALEYKNDISKFVSELEDELDVTRRLYKGRSERTGKVLTTELSAENASKIMNKADDEGYFYGLGSIRSTVAPKFKNTSSIKKAQDKLMSKTDFNNVKLKYENDFSDITKELEKYRNGMDNFGVSVAEDMGEYFKTGNKSIFNDLYENIPESLVKKVDEFGKQLVEMPTEYFEGKFNRVVDIDEFSHALIPEGTSQKTKDILDKKGIKYAEYSGSENRQEVLNNLLKTKELLFGLGVLTIGGSQM